MFEASAIATQLEKIDLSRPMTHDLMNDILNALEVKVSRIVITDLKNNTFFALIDMVKNGDDLMMIPVRAMRSHLP